MGWFIFEQGDHWAVVFINEKGQYFEHLAGENDYGYYCEARRTGAWVYRPNRTNIVRV